MPFYGRVEKPFWDDRPVAIIGGGPSLLGFDFEQLRGAHVLAVKGSIFDIPWADAGFGLDMLRYSEWADKLANVQSRVYWAVPDTVMAKIAEPADNVTFIRRLEGADVSDDPGAIYNGGTSGFGALQVALHKQAKQIVLFGYDYDGAYQHVIGRPFRDQRALRRQAQSAANWLTWANNFNVFASLIGLRGARVLNACPTSAIDCFEKITLEDGIAYICD